MPRYGFPFSRLDMLPVASFLDGHRRLIHGDMYRVARIKTPHRTKCDYSKTVPKALALYDTDIVVKKI